MKDKVYFNSTDIRYRNSGTEVTEVVVDMETEANKVEVTEADQKELEVMETDKEEVEVQNRQSLSTFELCEDNVGDIPTITYNFVSISDLAQCEKDTIIDVLGVVKSTGELVEITTKAGKELKKEIVLVDKSSSEVSLTLWGNNAENLDLSNAPILAAKNVTVSGNDDKTLLIQIKIIF